MFKRKVKQTKDLEDINFDQCVIGSFLSGKTTPIFQIQSKKGMKIATLLESIEYMCELGAIQAIENHDTGLNLAMLSLCKNESLTVDDSDFKEIKVTRIS
ncbi:hypothetical protein ACMGD3_23985 [Lysinibacillus sphaericus]|uniref:hypothetical protein n=1 Tax=Lysinibacillus sphaericus TaxID=1421 RepID=UPI003F7B04DD